ncbi:MAG: hypothetical protein IT281_01810 [Ignavibacteria bacterium]|nr:hypothetical protein [Ignavibacteria bacterium]MCC7158254.1 hypothetical protein [Ignavibacteria bacterium]
MDLQTLDFHSFVDDKLAEKGFRIKTITKDLMESRVDDFMNFVNSIRIEYHILYGWNKENKDYFLNPLIDKWKYSFTILDSKDEICFVNFSSVYNEIIHNHCTYARQDTRNFNFAKLHIIKLCQTGLDNGFSQQEGYWPKKNKGSIILFLRMGWQIEDLRNKQELYMTADLKSVRNKTYQLILTGK